MLTAAAIVLAWLALNALLFFWLAFGRWTKRAHHELRKARRI